MNLFNQFSYPLIAAGVLAVVSLLLIRLRVRLPALIAVQTTLVVVVVAAFLFLRTGDGDLSDITAYDALVANDRPTFIEFFSNFCTGCLVMRPSVDALIEDIDGEFNVLRVNIHSEAGRALIDRLTFSFTPEFIVLDADGREVWRDHVLPSSDILQRAQ